MAKIILAKSAGFCFGVKRAVEMVYNRFGKENVYTYGPIIHNACVVEEIEKNGVKVIKDASEIINPTTATIITRSHGISKKTEDALRATKAEIVDATCPFVLKIHKIVKEESAKGSQIVIIGNENHPEVEGIKGWATGEVFIVDTKEKAENIKLDPSRNVVIVSQTTFNYKKFQELVEILSKKGYNISIRNTICNATEERQTEARQIASQVDSMIVIGDSSSSNTRKLYEICLNECPNTFYIQTINDLELSKLSSSDYIGITAGASTPQNIIEEVYTNVRTEFCRDVR
ncbi:4-hydroxy-3-methylbut-2-enyl diphosphate reductase [Lachnospira multipara]|uniref:4-hydroxy-3-methylbut-2-enyl diphosphate reductase n=1 Tax=Lachnospira multipara TaxID=28051 RepID=A0A1H5RKL1_9FIRM|nr:4-hydroxy-3-methylbut-2-enyl diphosphate reductase [Lachnospira multipara]SEF38624.1 4-hydroxy-3-methylbut-2-enyl diphosphate reductase [Lachnospira multipara]